MITIRRYNKEIKEDLDEDGNCVRVGDEELWGIWYECPNCHEDVDDQTYGKSVYCTFKFCPMCGEKIEWVKG